MSFLPTSGSEFNDGDDFLLPAMSTPELDLFGSKSFETETSETGSLNGRNVSSFSNEPTTITTTTTTATTTSVAEQILDSKTPEIIFSEETPPLEDRSIKNYALLAITGAISLLCNPFFFVAGVAAGGGVASFRYYVAGGLQKFDPSKLKYAAHIVLPIIAFGNRLGEIFAHKVTILSKIQPNYNLLAKTAVVAHGAALGHAFVNYQLINNRFDKTHSSVA